MNIKYRELVEQNTNGLAVLYVDRSSTANHIFEEDRILWDPCDKGLALAEGTKMTIDSKKVVLIDSAKDLLGFYFYGGDEGDHKVLTPYYTPTFGDMPPPAPKRPRSKGYGVKLDKDALDFYLKNLKEFLS